MRYLWIVGTRSRAPLLPLALALFLLIGIFADPHQDIGQTWGLCAVLCCALSALLVGAILAGEPATQADMAVVALGGRARRLRLDLALVGAAGLALTVAYLAYPLVMTRFRPELFTRAVRPGDVLAAAIALAAAAVLGGALGLLFAPPRVTRRATAVAATLLAVVALVAVAKPLGWVSGPVGAAHALADAPAATVAADEIAACLACLALAAVCVLVAAAWTRRIA